MKAVFQSSQLHHLGAKLIVLGIAQEFLQVFLQVKECCWFQVTDMTVLFQHCCQRQLPSNVHGLVGLVSVYCDWVRHEACVVTSVSSVAHRLKTSKQHRLR